MEFDHNDTKYRLERGVGTGMWLLLIHHDDGHRGWRLIGSLPAFIAEEDIVDRAKVEINGSPQ